MLVSIVHPVQFIPSKAHKLLQSSFNRHNQSCPECHNHRWAPRCLSLDCRLDEINVGCPSQIRDSFDLRQAMRSYFLQLFPLNPGAILPSGPSIDDLGLDAPIDHVAGDCDAFFRRSGGAADTTIL